MIKLPIRVGADLRQRVEKSYGEAIRQVAEAEESYVRSKLPPILANLARGSEDWQSDLARAAKAMFEVCERLDPASAADRDLRSTLLAALFYLCNPYDVIPDRIPSTGYIDDAVVLNDCLRRIEQAWPQAYREITASIAKVRR